MKRPIPITLNLQDVRSLIDCKAQLDAVVSSLMQTNWAGARASIAALGIVDRLVCDLYNRCEPHWLRYLNRGTSEPAAPNPGDPATSVPPGSPAGSVQSEGEKV